MSTSNLTSMKADVITCAPQPKPSTAARRVCVMYRDVRRSLSLSSLLGISNLRSISI